MLSLPRCHVRACPHKRSAHACTHRADGMCPQLGRGNTAVIFLRRAHSHRVVEGHSFERARMCENGPAVLFSAEALLPGAFDRETSERDAYVHALALADETEGDLTLGHR
jgi:hypothetical protein